MMMTIITKVNDVDRNHYVNTQIGQEPMNRIEAGGKIALVSGAAGCIGPAAGFVLIRAGCVFGTSRNANREVQGIQMIRCNVTSGESVSISFMPVKTAGRFRLMRRYVPEKTFGKSLRKQMGVTD
jgi:hypothetical protein